MIEHPLREQNVFVISLIEQKRAIPVYWLLLPKRGCSNLTEQKKLIRPLLGLFKGYRILVLGDREFHSIKLANWLHSKGIGFVLRQKQGTYIRQENQPYQRLQSLGLIPGVSFFLGGIQATKQQGFAQFNLVGYHKRKYRGKGLSVNKVVSPQPLLSCTKCVNKRRFALEYSRAKARALIPS